MATTTNISSKAAWNTSCSRLIADAIFICLLFVGLYANAQLGLHLPDNMDTVECSFAPKVTEWGIETDWVSDTAVCTMLMPLVGDIDGDGIPEIICFAPSPVNKQYSAERVLVFDSRTHDVVHTFSMPSGDPVSGQDATPYGIVKLSNGHVIFVAITRISRTIQAYDLTEHGTTPIWSTSLYSFGAIYNAPVVGFADFNLDGFPEIYVGNKILDAETGTILLSGAMSNAGASYAHMNGTRKIPASFAADIVGDNHPDLILGNEIYEVQITNRTGTAGNTLTLAASITPPTSMGSDGHAQVADFNLDGHPDILISNKPNYSGNTYMYIWDVQNDSILAQTTITSWGSGKSMPLIADIDNDGRPEIVIQCRANDNKSVRAYKYDEVAGTLSLMWSISVDEDSYSNAMSAFDFNLDGMMELLITDQSTIKIANGSGKSHITGADTTDIYTMASFNVGQITVMQYPVVADVDADGHAEIVICGKVSGRNIYEGALNVFRSANVDWAPARKVWNQYMYDVTNVNEDLSIPPPFNNATLFTDPDGVERRPFNNFLQQATTFDQYGRPYQAAPDMVIPSGASLTIEDDYIHVDFEVCNQGDGDFYNDRIWVSFYRDLYERDRYLGFGWQGNNNGNPVTIAPGQCKPMEGYAPIEYFCAKAPMDSVALVVNNRSNHGIAMFGQPGECDTTNNVTFAQLHLIAGRDTIFDTVCQNTAYDTLDFHISDAMTAQSGIVFDSMGTTTPCGEWQYLHLTVKPVARFDTDITSCDSLLWHGVYRKQSGTYSDTSVAANLCDSITTLTLTINHSASSLHSDNVCDRYRWNDSTYTESCRDTLFLVNVDGCDSSAMLDITIRHSTFGDTADTSCNRYVWHGRQYAASGDYDDTLYGSNAVGCDSTVQLHLIIRHTTEGDTLVHACDSFVWRGQSYVYAYNNEAVARDTIHRGNSEGCDSIVTLRLTLHSRSDYQLPDVYACGSYQWHDSVFAVSDAPYSFSDTLRSVWGCDSVLLVTIYVHPTYNDTVVDSFPDGNIYNYAGTTYTAGGDYQIAFHTVAGCDSIVTLRLSIIPPCDTFLQFPNVVTPNGDGVNDRFVIKNLLELQCYESNSLVIYNRWGSRVYWHKNIRTVYDFWNPAEGNYSAGAYYYVFRATLPGGKEVEHHGVIEVLK